MKKYVVNTFNCHLSKRVWSLNWLLIAGFVVSLSACKKTATDDVTPQLSTSSSANQSVDGWILDEMRYLYYWNDKIPANPDTTLAPDKFFSSILNTYNATTNPTGDRFSWIEDDGNTLKSELSGQSTTTGMNFTLYLRSSGSTDVIAQVLYVLPNSPAAKAGLKRGDIISKVGGTSLSTTNYSDLLFTGTTFTYGLASLNGQSLVDTDKTVTVTATVFQENPVFMDSVYTVGSKKVGYFVYNQFRYGSIRPG